jgi:pSer/pThr/pTyr-binding forkhead associated (FHA) protein
MSTTRRISTHAALVIGLAMIVTLGLAAIAAQARAQATPDAPPDKLTSVVQPSIVHVRAQYSGLVRDRQGNDLNHGRAVTAGTSCSGFIVDPNGYITTAGQCLDLDLGAEHVIDALAERLWRRDHARSTGRYATLGELQEHARAEWTVVSSSRPSHVRPDREVRVAYGASIGARPTSLRLPARVRRVRSFDNGDVALVKIEAQDLPALELAGPAPVRTETVSVGFDAPVREGIAPTFEPGSITAKKTVAEGLRNVYKVSAPLSTGMAGGPTVALDGRVVGVNSVDPDRAPRASNLISPASEVAQLLRDEGVRNEVGQTNRVYRSAVDAFFRGDRQTALARLSLVLKLQPANKLAQRFRVRALGLPVAKGGISLLFKILGMLGLAFSGAIVRFGRPRVRGRSRMWRRREPADAQLPVLVVENGPSAGRRFSIASRMVIGRDRADVALADPQVSRRHAAISPLGHNLEIEDLESANGTSVNGKTIDGPRTLSDGDVVQVGDTRLVVQVRALRGDATVFSERRPEARIVVNNGPLTGESRAVLTEVVIGRSDADLVLDDTQVSRHHALIRWVRGELLLDDLRSTNGTRVNGVRIDGSRTLRDGDVITVGPFAIEVHITASGESDAGATAVGR